MKCGSIFVSSIVWLGLLCSCSEPPQAPVAESKNLAIEVEGRLPRIYVVNYPLQYFTQRIVGEDAEVVLPKSSGGDPAFWKPTDQEIQAFQEADLILLWGADFAKWVPGVSLPIGRVVDTGAAIKERFIFEEAAVTHSHGDEGEHSHGAVAFTTWLDFDLMVQQCDSIHDHLVKRFPKLAQALGKRQRALVADLKDLDRRFKAAVPDRMRETVFASHPVYQYFARRYGVQLVNFHWEPGETPSEKEWEKLLDRQQVVKARWMLWEGAPTQETIEKLAEAGIEPILFHPQGGWPEEGDFLSIMREQAERLSTAWQAADATRP